MPHNEDTPRLPEPGERARFGAKVRALWEQYLSLWGRLDGMRLLGFLLLHYTALFLITCALVFHPVFQSGKSLIWQGDSLSQHFPRFLYISETFREAAHSFFTGGGWNFPLYDFRVGLTMQDAQMGFPQILAALCPPEYMVTFYGFYILLNHWLAGLAFVVFGWYFRADAAAALAGALGYAFCGYALAAAVWHPHFMTPMFCLPLLIVGTEQVLRARPAWMLPVSVYLSLTAQNGLYFSCMQVVFVLLYALFRFFDLYGRGGELEAAPRSGESGAGTDGGAAADGKAVGGSPLLREGVRAVGRLALWGGMGILLAGFCVLPSLMSIVDIGRVGKDVASYENLSHYALDYYRRFLAGFVGTPGELSDWTCLGFTGLSVPCLVLLFQERRREGRTLRRMFLCLTGMLWVPAAGYVLSGFSNVSNRFCFAYAFCVSAAVMFLLPRILELDGRGLGLLTAGAVLYAALVSGQQVLLNRNGQQAGVPLVLLSIAAMLAALGWRGVVPPEPEPSPVKTPSRTGRARRFFAACLAVTLLSVWCGGWIWYSPRQRNSTGSLVADPWGQIQEGQYFSLSQSREIAADTDFFRVAGDSVSVAESNLSWYYGFNGVSMFPYYGYSAPWLDWVSETEMSRTNTGRGTLLNLDTRAPMLSLASIKYFALRWRNKPVYPYGFSFLENVENGDSYDVILKNQNWLPLGYTYDRWMSRALYDAMEAPLQEEAQCQALLLEEAPTLAGLEEVRLVEAPACTYAADREAADETEELSGTAAAIPAESQERTWRIVDNNQVEWADGCLYIYEDGAWMTLGFDGLPDTQTYLRVVDLDLTDGNSDARWQLRADTDDTYADSLFIADAFVYAYGQHSQIFDLGYSEEPRYEITLTFPVAGTYRLGDLQIWQRSMEGYPDQMARLRAEPLEDVVLNRRGLTGSVTVSRDKLLCLAIPRMRGWKAYLDGKPVKLYAANTAFMAVEVPTGTHSVELRYTLAGWPLGVWMSMAGIALAVGTAVRLRKQREPVRGPRR